MTNVPGPSGVSDPAAPDDELPSALHHVLVGTATALVSLALVVVPTVLSWLLDARSTGSFGSATATGAALWFLAQGARLTGGGGVVGITPLLLVLVPLAVAVHGARTVVREADVSGEHVAGLLPRGLVAAGGLWWAGMLLVTVPALLLTRSAPLAPVLWTTVGAVLAVPSLALLLALRPLVAADPEILGPRVPTRLLPDPVLRGLRPAFTAAGLLLAVGAVVVLASLAVHLTRVEHLASALQAGAFGGTVLFAAQVAALPNLALWVVSFLAGPGFQVVSGATTTWSGSRAGIYPMLPVLGALPEPGTYPAAVALVVLVPILVGVWLGRACLATTARLASARTKLTVALSAVMVAAGSLGVLDLLGGGALGSGRLADVGAPAGWLTLCLAAELLVGALPVVAVDAWRLRR